MLNLLKNGEVMRQVKSGSTLNYDGFYTSPAEAGKKEVLPSGDVFELVLAPVVPEPEPEPQTLEELRAQMPPLTSRQIWLGAHSLGMSKADVKANTDDPEILIEIEEATEFHRTYESVVMMSSIMGITPEQLDDVWMWWASA